LKSPKRIKDTPLKGKWFVNNVYYLEHNPKLPANSCKRCLARSVPMHGIGASGASIINLKGYSMPEMKVFLKGSICPVVSEKWRKLWRIEGSNRAQKSAGFALFEKGVHLNSICGVTTHLSISFLSWSVVDVAGLFFFFCSRSLNHEKRKRENLYERNCLTIDTEHAQCWTHDQWRRSENSRVLLYGSNWKQVSYGSDDS